MKLQFYQASATDNQQIKDYLLEDDTYTAHPSELIKTNKPERSLIKIHAEETLVGFFAIDLNAMPEFCTQEHVVIRALSISEAHRRKHYAKEALESLPLFLKQHFPQVKTILLAVNHANQSGQNLYKKVGFHDTQKRKFGQLGEQFIFKKELS